MDDNFEKDKYSISWHFLEIKDVFKQVGSSEKGLSEEEVFSRQEKLGLNKLPSKKAPNIFIIFFRQFLSPLIYILIVAGIISLILAEWVDALFIFAVILLNSFLGAWQEGKAEKNASALQNLLKIKARVRRDGVEKNINAEKLVVGDIVFLESGVKSPADIRLFDAKRIQVDQSFLTGESELVKKDTEKNKKDNAVNNRSNMVFAGSTVASGRAWGVVVETGLRTEVGKIADIVIAAQKIKPPLILRMEKFNKKIFFIVLFFCLFLAILTISQGTKPVEAFFLVVALAVSAIPEGLPVALTVALSVATTRMSKKKVIVKKLAAVEGLGSCTMIASDKTGTLTVNQQTAKLIYLPSGQEIKISGQGYNGEGEIENKKSLSENDKESLNEVIKATVLANEATLKKKAKFWRYNGDSMDVAFLALAYKNNLSIDNINASYKKLLEIPYESERRYAGEIYEDVSNKKSRIAIKGSVEKVLGFCSSVKINGKRVDIDRNKIRQKGEELASSGFRVLAVAEGDFDYDKEINLDNFKDKMIKNLNFLSLVCFIDPLRKESKDAVMKAKEAGVQVSMITGDHPATAFFIAKEIGIAYSLDEVITEKELGPAEKEITPEFLKIISKTKVFAGVSPLQKLKIVDALSKLGHLVAVTGDGVNDAPALKQANIGVAMGSGTDVAKETATMIVIDDNFSSIVRGIEEGRFAYDNVRKVVYLAISCGAAEVIIFLLAVFFKMPLPLFAAQLLWLNVVTDGIQTIALAFESGEKGAMKRPPRPPKEGVFNKMMINQTLFAGLIMGLLSFGAWFYFINIVNLDENVARNLILTLMVLFQNFHTFNCRSEITSTFKIAIRKNLILFFGVLGVQALHIGATYTPFMQKILKIQPISINQWILLLVLSSTVLWGMEIFKLFRRKARKRKNN
jgi:P-type Ca2+ transporter type 2C